jgi:chemotaxis protein methyltransferase CheR
MIVRTSPEPERFRDWIAQKLGLNFDDDKLEFLADVLRRRAHKSGLTPPLYLEGLENPGTDTEIKALAVELTVPETYFFRHFDQFRAFSEVAVPAAQAARASSRTMTVLSAGCASGEEAYSLAILVRERPLDPGWKATFHAVDLNPDMLAKAASGRYSAWALRETPPELQRRWFRGAGREFALEEAIRGAVQFRQLNLADENSGLWVAGRYDVIFCRNVLMYFTPSGAQALIARLTRSLAPRGYLFLGHAETLRGLSSDFHLCHTHGTFYYQRKAAFEASSEEEQSKQARGPLESGFPRASLPECASAEASAAPFAESVSTGTWLETIQRASDRIEALIERSATRSAAQATGVSNGPRAASTQPALELLKQERFVDALEALAHLPAQSKLDPDTILLRAALLTHSGQLEEAERVSAQLIRKDELNAGAHYLLALCRESAGDGTRAIEHDQTAIYLDPSFAMPRLHLGLMARRRSDTEAARRELGLALVLLRREDASRLLLFGGGFAREALISLCRAELKSTGGTA